MKSPAKNSSFGKFGGGVRMAAGFLLRLAKVAGLSVLAALVLLVAGQRFLLYHPARDGRDGESGEEARRRGFEPWIGGDGRLMGLRSVARGDGRAVSVLIFHGNAGRAVDRTGYAELLREALLGQSVSVYILEYPGYGARGGSPTQSGLLAAARDAVSELAGAGPILVLGESLGTGVACAMAADRPGDIRGVLLVTPFDTMTNVARHHYPWLPVDWFLFDRYPSLEWIGNYCGGLGMVLAGRDSVIPPEIGRNLYDSYRGPKKLVVVGGADHNDAVSMMKASDWKELLEFLLDGGEK